MKFHTRVHSYYLLLSNRVLCTWSVALSLKTATTVVFILVFDIVLQFFVFVLSCRLGPKVRFGADLVRVFSFHVLFCFSSFLSRHF